MKFAYGERLSCIRQLQYIIENYKRLYPNNSFWANFDPDLCTWHQVQDEISKAEYEYQQKGKANFVRRVFRKDGLTRTLSPLLEGIPENDGLGILKGALIILFNARSTLSYVVGISTNKQAIYRPSRAGHGPVKRSSNVSIKSRNFSEVHTRP